MTHTTCPKCGKPSDPKSTRKGYCTEDMLAARAAFKAMIADKPTKAERDAAHLELFNRAIEAGNEAAAGVTPTPMIVAQHANPLDDNSAVVRAWKVDSGACGFAWVDVRPGNSSFALWLKATNRARKSYRGGVSIWSGNVGGQSIEIKSAWADAVARVLTEAGVKAYAESRLD